VDCHESDGKLLQDDANDEDDVDMNKIDSANEDAELEENAVRKREGSKSVKVIRTLDDIMLHRVAFYQRCGIEIREPYDT
jgi:hypothetical protein